MNLRVRRFNDGGAVRKAYRLMARRHHPDKINSSDATCVAAATARFQKVEEAYRMLGRPTS